MKEKIRKFMDEPLTIRRELKINLIALGIFAIPYAILVIYGIYKSNKAIEEFNEEVDARIDEMKKRCIWVDNGRRLRSKWSRPLSFLL